MDRTIPGPARAAGLRLLAQDRREGLTLSGLGVLIERAEIIHEGDVVVEDGVAHFFGSTLFTLDLDALGGCLAKGCEVDGSRLLDHLSASPFFRVHLMRLARAEILRRTGAAPETPLRVEMRGRVEGRRICIDLDVEAHGIRVCREVWEARANWIPPGGGG